MIVENIAGFFTYMDEQGGLNMRMYDLIAKKRNGEALTEAEINYMITEYVAGNIPDYQMSAFLMEKVF